MKIAKICPNGAECAKLYLSRLTASLLKIYSFTVCSTFVEKNKIAVESFVKKVDLEMWKSRFDGQEMEKIG
eukprot:snap_masked-scaffold_93-processed-gene-0.24-mRNA-1 protein AED:1.00 eAED:1.00 QI:0/0/0/0/1/1/2/0/70